jgi:flagellin-specific chaperone FliS
MDDRLREANVKKQKEPIIEVISRLQVMRDSWAEMLRQRQEQNDLENSEGLESATA